MTGRRTRQQIHEDVIFLLRKDGPQTISEIRRGCFLTYGLAQDVLSSLIEGGEVDVYWADRDSGHRCAHYSISEFEVKGEEHEE